MTEKNNSETFPKFFNDEDATHYALVEDINTGDSNFLKISADRFQKILTTKEYQIGEKVVCVTNSGTLDENGNIPANAGERPDSSNFAYNDR